MTSNDSQPTTRRPKGDGAIYEEADGRWRGVIDLGRGPDGKRLRRKVTGKTKQDVGRKLKAVQREHADGIDVARTAPTIAAVALEWLEKAAPRTMAVSTLSMARRRVNQHIIPGVGAHRVDLLRPEHIEAWLADEAENGAARATVAKYRSDLRQIINRAQRRRLVSWNAAAVAELPFDARAPVARRSLTAEQAEALLDALEGDRLGPYFTVLLLLGLRPGEAEALTWEAINFDAATIRVDRALKRLYGGKPVGIGTTKTKSTRVLGMTERVAAVLRHQRTAQKRERLAAGAGWTKEPQWAGLVFTTEVGTPADPANTRRSFAAACDRAGLPRFTPYELRHSAASLLIADGVPDREVADLLGHTDTRMLDRHYRHRVEPVVTAHVAAMDRLAARVGSPAGIGSPIGSPAAFL